MEQVAFRDKFIKIVLEICLSKTSLKADNAKLFHLLRDNLQNVRNSRLSLSHKMGGQVPLYQIHFVSFLPY